MKKQLTVVLIMLILAMVFAAGVNLQSQERDLVIESMAASNVPIKIDSFNVKDVRIKSGEKFSGSNEWLKDLKINIENTSGKTATHMSFGILIPRPDEQKGIPPAHYRISRGDKTNALKGTDSEFKVVSEINKNQASISLSEEELEGLFSFLSSLSYPTKIKKIKVHIEEVVFDDGTMWSVGTWYRIDPNDLKNPIRIEEKGSAGNSTAFGHMKIIEVKKAAGGSIRSDYLAFSVLTISTAPSMLPL